MIKCNFMLLTKGFSLGFSKPEKLGLRNQLFKKKMQFGKHLAESNAYALPMHRQDTLQFHIFCVFELVIKLAKFPKWCYFLLCLGKQLSKTSLQVLTLSPVLLHCVTICTSFALDRMLIVQVTLHGAIILLALSSLKTA